MKYSVTNNNVATEFVDMQSAENYATSLGLPTSVVTEVLDDIHVGDASSSVEFFEQKVREGYAIPDTPYVLAMEDADRAQFSAMLTLIITMSDAGYINDDTPQSIKDKNDNIITLTTGQFKSIMIGYGIYYKTIWNNCTPKS